MSDEEKPVIAKALSKDDIHKLSAGEVNVYVSEFKSTTDIPGSVVSSAIFKSPLARTEKSLYKDESEFMRMGHIDLAIPVLNPFIAQSSGALYAKIVNKSSILDYLKSEENNKKSLYDSIDGDANGDDEDDEEAIEEEFDDYDDSEDEDQVEDKEDDKELDKTQDKASKWVTEVMHGHKVFDRSTRKLVEPDSISNYNGESILIGGEIFKYFSKVLLDNIDTEINRELFRIFICPGKSDMEKNSIIKYCVYNNHTIVKEPKEPDKMEWLWDDYYIFLSNENDKAAVRRQRDKLTRKKGDLQKKRCRINLLLEIKKNPDVLTNMVMEAMLVLPIGVRATINDRVHELTMAYNNIVNANDSMQRALSQTGLKTKITSYQNLYSNIEFLMVKKGSIVNRNKATRQFKSLVDTLSGKKGIIREKLQAVRLDYTGRSVIAFDKDMPIDSLGVPYEMLYSLLLKYIQEYYMTPHEGQSRFKVISDKITKKNIKKNKHIIDEICEDLYCICGRQPTLHRLGMQGFKVVPVEGKSLLLSPLVVMPFNADFDGDQMHVEMPITFGSREEVKNVMGIIRNLAYPKNGSITVEPRHEILYGLWACSVYCIREQGKDVRQDLIDSDRDLFEKICKQEVNIYDNITFPTSCSKGSVKAGLWAIAYCCRGQVNADDLSPCDINGSKKEMKYNESFFTKQLTKVAARCQKELRDGKSDGGDIIRMISDITELGFAIARIWVPTLCSNYYPQIKQYTEEFNKRISEREKLVKLGLELDSAYTSYFSNEVENLKKKISKEMLDKLELNGLVLLMKAGARGSESNLMQMFGMRGQIMKDGTEAFNAIIKSSLSGQLTPLEHFITAYGSRQGIADKTLETANTGYLTRQLEHICSSYQIEGPDCEDEEGLHWKFWDLYYINDESVLRDIAYNNMVEMKDENYEPASAAIYNKIEPMIVGRSVILTKDEVAELGTAYKGISYSGSNNVAYYVKDKDIAKKILKGRFDNPSSPGIRVRSPLTCKCPTCKICYGRSMTNLIEDEVIGDKIIPNYPEEGTSIANIAAEAIGEPGTQLTMKNFQRGGVKSKSNLTSSAKKVKDYFSLFAHKSKDIGTNVLPHDPIVADGGKVVEVSLGNGTKKVYVDSNKGKTYILHDNIELKKYVSPGDNLQLVQGDLDIVEMLKNTPDNTPDKSYSVFKAAKYLLTMLHGIFNEETTLNMKHFEVLVAGLIRFTITRANSLCRSNGFKTGDSISLKDYRDFTEYSADKPLLGFWCLYGMNDVNVYKTDFFDTFFMERITTNAPVNMILNNSDKMEHPLTRVSFGLDAGFKVER